MPAKDVPNILRGQNQVILNNMLGTISFFKNIIEIHVCTEKDTKLYMANCLELSKNSDITSNFFFQILLIHIF